MFRKILVTHVAVLLASLLWAPAAMAWAPAEGPLFNNPKGTYAAKYRLVLRIEKAIRNAPGGSTVLISTYLLDRKVSVDALVAARRRGVHVRVVMDGGINTGPARRLKEVLNRDNGNRGLQWGPDGSFAIQCAGSCRGGGDNQAMHAKFYAFSRTGTARNVVMVSSGNLNKGGAVKGYNDLFTMRGVERTFAMYKKVHDEMSRDRVDGDPYEVRREGRFESQVFPKRGATRATDPTYVGMSRVHCRGATGDAGRRGRTMINVAMFHWQGDRGMYLARKLVDLSRNGCIVRVIYGAPSKEVSTYLRGADRRGLIDLHDSRVDRNGDGAVDLRVHSKYMLINGSWGNDTSSWQVFAGSQNWTQQGLTGGDENTVRVSSRPGYVGYLNNWNFIREHGARSVGR